MVYPTICLFVLTVSFYCDILPPSIATDWSLILFFSWPKNITPAAMFQALHLDGGLSAYRVKLFWAIFIGICSSTFLHPHFARSLSYPSSQSSPPFAHTKSLPTSSLPSSLRSLLGDPPPMDLSLAHRRLHHLPLQPQLRGSEKHFRRSEQQRGDGRPSGQFESHQTFSLRSHTNECVSPRKPVVLRLESDWLKLSLHAFVDPYVYRLCQRRCWFLQLTSFSFPSFRAQPRYRQVLAL
jgi:hypothetical protein